MGAVKISPDQARRFLLCRQGLTGTRRFRGEEGVLAFIRQAGCVQYDPVDVCGRNADLVLQSRVEDYNKGMLERLLYEDRRLIDHFDKNMSILPVEDWPHFAWRRRAALERATPDLHVLATELLAVVGRRGPLCARDLDPGPVKGRWGSSSPVRDALDWLYARGELTLHHKQGTQKYYAPAGDCLPAALLGAPTAQDGPAAHRRWRVKRRIGAVGLLWNRPSDAWLGIPGFKAGERNQAFGELREREEIFPLAVEGLTEPLFALAEDRAQLLSAPEGTPPEPRTELLAPLDNLLWDRKLVSALFGFDYKWEIYTPADQRRYGAYVLPLLSGEAFLGRAEPVVDRKAGTLVIRNLWLEPGVTKGQRIAADLPRCFRRFAAFHGVVY